MENKKRDGSYICMLPSWKQWICLVPDTYVCYHHENNENVWSHAYVCYHQENKMSGPIHGMYTCWCRPQEGRQQWTGFLCVHVCTTVIKVGSRPSWVTETAIITHLSVAFRNAFHAASAGPLSRMDLAGLALPVLGLLLSNAQGCKDFWKTSKPCHIGIHWIALTEWVPNCAKFLKVFCIILYWPN